MRSRASVKVSAASTNLFSLKSAFPARSISSMRRCRALSTSSDLVVVAVAAAVAATEAEDEDEDEDDEYATLDLVGVLPESMEPASFPAGDDDEDDDDDRDAFFDAEPPVRPFLGRSSLEVAYQTAAAVAMAARPMTTNVVVRLSLLLPMFVSRFDRPPPRPFGTLSHPPYFDLREGGWSEEDIVKRRAS
jgi:hypothetical protein